MLNREMTAKPHQLVSLDAGAGRGGALFGMDEAELSKKMGVLGEETWRAQQLAQAMYRQWLTDIEEVTTLPKELRGRMVAEGWRIGRPGIVRVFESADGTERYLVECEDGTTVETVWMPEGDGSESADDGEYEAKIAAGPKWDRATICVSSQVGCAVGCQFCLTARLGLQRNLSAGEIAGQVVAVMQRQGVVVGRDRVNLVFMGMGEPLLNYEEFMGALRLLVHEVGLSPRRMTVSTSGIVPGIERLAQESAETRPRLAISLNAPNDELRSEVMPINRKWPIASVIDAVKKIRLRKGERVTLEYVLLGGVTDRPMHAREVAKLARRSGVPMKVNLIAWNPGPGIEFVSPDDRTVEAFKEELAAAGVPVYLRKPRGRDIFAACGQLKRTAEG